MSPAFASPRSFLLPLLAACLAVAGSPRLAPAQTPGTQDPAFNSVTLNGSSVFTQVLQIVDGSPSLLAAGDHTGLSVLDPLTGGGAIANTVFGSGARIIYTAVPEVVPQADGGNAQHSGRRFVRQVGDCVGEQAARAQRPAGQPGRRVRSHF